MQAPKHCTPAGQTRHTSPHLRSAAAWLLTWRLGVVSASLPGQTGAGKSFTMMGSGASTIAEGLRDQGLTPRLCAGLFARIEQMQRDGAAGKWDGKPCHDPEVCPL